MITLLRFLRTKPWLAASLLGALSPSLAVAQNTTNLTRVERIEILPTVLRQPNSMQPAVMSQDDERCLLNRVRAVLPRTDGGLLVANAGAHQFCLFDSQGNLAKVSGRKGGGPGEFGNVTLVVPARADSVLVYDNSERRYSLLSPTGEYIRSIPIEKPEGLGSVIQFIGLHDGSILVGYSNFISGRPSPDPLEITMTLFRYDANGKALGRVHVSFASEHFVQVAPPQNGGVAYWDRSFGRRAGLVPFEDGFVVGDARDLLVEHRGADGQLRRNLRIELPKQKVESGDIAAYERTERARARPANRAMVDKLLDEMPYPDYFPSFGQLVSGNTNELWFEMYRTPRVRPDSQRVWIKWSSLGGAQYVTLPERFRLMSIVANKRCGVLRNEDDVETAVCYSGALQSRKD